MKAEQAESRSVVVYDGDCPYCRRQMAWVQARDREAQFEFIASRTPGLLQRFPVLTGQDFNTGLRFLGRGGSVSVAADAVYQIVRRLPGWRWLAWLYRVPILHFLARKTYGWIAAHRQSLAGSCEEECSARK